MTGEKSANGTELTMNLDGRLGTTTAPQFDTELKDGAGVTEHIFDFSALAYISSVLLRAQKTMAK